LIRGISPNNAFPLKPAAKMSCLGFGVRMTKVKAIITGPSMVRKLQAYAVTFYIV